MIPRARRPPVEGSGFGVSAEERARAGRTTSQRWVNNMAEDEFERGGAAARRSLNAWLSGRKLSNS